MGRKRSPNMGREATTRRVTARGRKHGTSCPGETKRPVLTGASVSNSENCFRANHTSQASPWCSSRNCGQGTHCGHSFLGLPHSHLEVLENESRCMFTDGEQKQTALYSYFGNFNLHTCTHMHTHTRTHTCTRTCTHMAPRLW